jgi:hypothetical protein
MTSQCAVSLCLHFDQAKVLLIAFLAHDIEGALKHVFATISFAAANEALSFHNTSFRCILDMLECFQCLEDSGYHGSIDKHQGSQVCWRCAGDRYEGNEQVEGVDTAAKVVNVLHEAEHAAEKQLPDDVERVPDAAKSVSNNKQL